MSREMRETAKKHLEKQRKTKPDHLAEKVKGLNRVDRRNRVIESFSWLTGDFKTVDAGKNTIKIRGVALRSDSVSRNNRKYVESELVKSARTLIGKKVTINHDNQQIVGNVDWAEFENGALEYLATIKKQPYVNMLRDKSAEIRGVSVEANYLHNKCLKCGEQFETEEGFQIHMKEAHFIKSGITAPHGINYSALSLVLSPEQPGVKDTSIELFETAPGQNQLFETIMKEYDMVQSKGLAHSGRVKVGEQEMDHGCGPDETWDAETEQCVKKSEEKPVEEQEGDHGCTEDQVWNPTSKTCEPIPEAAEHLDEILSRGTKLQLKQAYDKILTYADRNVREIRESKNKFVAAMVIKFADVNTRLQALEKQDPKPSLKESEDKMRNLEKRITEMENSYSHIRGQFKGHNKILAPTKQDADYSKPSKVMHETARKQTK